MFGNIGLITVIHLLSFIHLFHRIHLSWLSELKKLVTKTEQNVNLKTGEIEVLSNTKCYAYTNVAYLSKPMKIRRKSKILKHGVKFSQRYTVMHGLNMFGIFKRLLYEIYLVISNKALSQCSLNCVDYFGVQLCEILRKIATGHPFEKL